MIAVRADIGALIAHTRVVMCIGLTTSIQKQPIPVCAEIGFADGLRTPLFTAITQWEVLSNAFKWRLLIIGVCI